VSLIRSASPAMTETASAPPAEKDRRERTWWLPVGVAAASAVMFALVRPHLIDDTFITLSYARNLAFHGHWGLIEQGTSNTATSPLNVLALAALTLVLRDAVLACGVLFVVCQVSLALALRRAGTHTGLPTWFAPLALAMLTVNPLLLSSVGLEVALGAAGVAWLLVFATERRPVALGLVIGLLALTRLDLLVVAVVIFVARDRFWAGAWKSVLAAGAVALPWFTFSWLVLGSAMPDTLIIKMLQKSWGEWSFTNGPELYHRVFPWATVWSFVPVGMALLAAAVWVIALPNRGPATTRLWPFGALVPAGLAHYLAYSRLHVPPYHWYYGPSIVAATVFLAAAVAAVAGTTASAAAIRRSAGIGALGVAVVLVAASAAYFAWGGLPRTFAPFTTNHSWTAQYEQIGPELGRLVGAHTVRSGGEIGVLAYTCDCAIIDLFDDRGAVAPAIAERKAHLGSLGRALIDLNFRYFDYGLQPQTSDFALIATTGSPPADPLAHWTITAPWTGTQQLYLVHGNGNGA
jgi:hypothetical protein